MQSAFNLQPYRKKHDRNTLIRSALRSRWSDTFQLRSDAALLRCQFSVTLHGLPAVLLQWKIDTCVRRVGGTSLCWRSHEFSRFAIRLRYNLYESSAKIYQTGYQLLKDRVILSKHTRLWGHGLPMLIKIGMRALNRCAQPLIFSDDSLRKLKTCFWTVSIMIAAWFNLIASKHALGRLT